MEHKIDYSKEKVISASSKIVEEGCPLVVDNNSVMVRKHLSFSCYIDGSLGEGLIRFGHGKDNYSATYFELDSKFLTLYHRYECKKEFAKIEHGLDISDFLRVNLDVGYGLATITLFTKSGMRKDEKLNYAGRAGDVYVECEKTVLHDVKANWFADNYDSNVWLFGDSYFTPSAPARWTSYLFRDGYKNNFFCAYPGMRSERAIADFKQSLERGTPNFAVWCMGMNDGDSETGINDVWLNCITEFISLCKENNITPILSTIPTCPKKSHIFKNQWVRESGYRYIDFNEAVGSDKTENHKWYDEMLCPDEVHPLVRGAQALYMQALVDFPEIMM